MSTTCPAKTYLCQPDKQVIASGHSASHLSVQQVPRAQRVQNYELCTKCQDSWVKIQQGWLKSTFVAQWGHRLYREYYNNEWNFVNIFNTPVMILFASAAKTKHAGKLDIIIKNVNFFYSLLPSLTNLVVFTKELYKGRNINEARVLQNSFSTIAKQ